MTQLRTATTDCHHCIHTSRCQLIQHRLLNVTNNNHHVCVCVCVVRPHLGDIFVPWTKLARTFFLVRTFLGSLENLSVFSILGMHVSVSLRPVLRSEHCSCSVCVCSTAYVTTRKLDDLCVVRPHLGDIFVQWTKRARTFFLARTFFGSLEKACVFL